MAESLEHVSTVERTRYTTKMLPDAEKMVSAWAGSARLVLAQKAIETGSMCANGQRGAESVGVASNTLKSVTSIAGQEDEFTNTAQTGGLENWLLGGDTDRSCP